MNILLKSLVGVGIVLGSMQVALAAIDPCGVASEIKGKVDNVNAAIANGTMPEMEKSLNVLGIDVPKGGESVIVKVLQSEQGHLYTTLKVAEHACDNQKEIVHQANVAKQKAEHLAWELSHQLHRHCGRYGHGRHRHFACRMVR